jgi:hypothetical protein
MPEIKPRKLSYGEIKYGTNRNHNGQYPSRPQKIVRLKPLPPEHLE